MRNWIIALAAACSLTAVAHPGFAQETETAPAAPEPAGPRVSFDDLQARVRAVREQQRQINQQRETAARNELARQETRAAEQERRRDREEARSRELDEAWNANTLRLQEAGALLAQKQGNLGELFGVTRQVAGDAANVLQASMLTAQYAPAAGSEERVEFLRRLAAARDLPSIVDLERMWFELVREMTNAAKVERFTAGVQKPDPERPDQPDATIVEQAELVRIGPFTAVRGGDFLGYLSTNKTFTVLDGHLPGEYRAIAQGLADTPAGSGYTRAVADPARGALLGLYLERPNIIERIEGGEVVGYVIITVGAIGFLVAVFQYAYLFMAKSAVARQLRHLDRPRRDNALGRVLLAFRDGGRPGEPRELAELRLSEAVLRELPKLERFQSLLRLAVAAGPLLGLIGTVIGMIITFKAIVGAGTSDPRLMAQGIGQAMIATVLGLGIAIPLLFINAGLSGLSRGITQILDEQTHELLADEGSRRA